jgi:hypothetical protein
MLVKGFTRPEVSELTGVSVHRLQYLDRIGLIVGYRTGNSKKPVLLYTWNQVLQVLYVRDSRKHLSDEDLVHLVKMLDESICYKAALAKFESTYEEEELVHYAWFYSDTNFYDMVENMFREMGLLKPGDVVKLEDAPPVTNIVFLRPIVYYVKEVIEAVKKSTFMDYSDFLHRSGLINESELTDLISLAA